MTQEPITIYTDGSCLGNPGPGGWGAVIKTDAGSREISGAEPSTTNNRMELTAAIRALESVEAGPPVRIVTDSRYVMDGITSWIAGWRRRNWRTASGRPVKNQDLWRQLDQVASKHNLEWAWVRGHSLHPGNEHADALARAASLTASK